MACTSTGAKTNQGTSCHKASTGPHSLILTSKDLVSQSSTAPPAIYHRSALVHPHIYHLTSTTSHLPPHIYHLTSTTSHLPPPTCYTPCDIYVTYSISDMVYSATEMACEMASMPSTTTHCHVCHLPPHTAQMTGAQGRHPRAWHCER